MAFWNKLKKQSHTTHSNAPRHWPVVKLDQFEIPGVNLITIVGQLSALHAPPATTIALMHDFLYEDGILQVPVVVEENGVKTCVFAYSNHDTEAAAHYSGVRALLKARENAAAVYYGPEALVPAKPLDVLRPIDTPNFSKPDPPVENASFALWWATPEDPLFSQSPDRLVLDPWFEAIDGYGYLAFSAFVNDLELVEEKKPIYALPSQPFLHPLTGPAHANLLLHASAPEGIFLAFNEATTPVRTRHLLLTLLANFATQYRAAIEAKEAPVSSEETGLATWRQIRDGALAKEAEGATGLTLHAVTIRDGQPLRIPDARSAEEKRTQPATPGRAELDFGMDLVDRVVARLKQRPVAQSSQQELGQPNVFPIIAVKAGGHLWERQLPYEDAEVAQAAAARVRDEWPDAEMVAVLLDAAIRENGVRTDILSVTIENAAGVAVDLMQRYKTSAAGEMELVGRPTASPTKPFLLARTAVPEGVPEAGLEMLAAQALDEIVKHITIGAEPSGMLSDDANGVLTSPSAFVGTGEPRLQVRRFALQGPVTAAMTCAAVLAKNPAPWVVFYIDDLVTKDGEPDRRLRLCVQRRIDPGTAIFDQRYEQPVKGKPFAPRGGLEFRRWGGPFLSPAE